MSSTNIAIGAENGQVFMRFEHALEWVAMDAQNAKDIAEAISRAAYKARYGKEPKAGHSTVTKTIRTRMINRVCVMLVSLENKELKYQASQIVDSILAEVL